MASGSLGSRVTVTLPTNLLWHAETQLRGPRTAHSNKKSWVHLCCLEDRSSDLVSG